MKRFVSILIKKIQYWRLDERKSFQNKSGIDWHSILMMLEAGMISEPMARDLLQVIETDIEQLKDFPDATHRLPDAEQFYVNGRPHVRLGHLVGDPELEFGIRFDSAAFLVIAGLIGFGKTTAVRRLLKGIHDYNQLHPDKTVVVLVFDRKGGDYADMPVQFGWKHYDIYKTLRLSLQAPPGIAPQVWINMVATLFCARTGLKAAWVTVANALRWLLAVLNPTSKEPLLWPDFGLLLAVLNALPDTAFSSKAEYTRSLRQPLEGIVHATMETFTAFRGFQAHDLIDNGQSAVISMPSMLPSWSRQFFVDLILSSILQQRIATSHRVDDVEVFCIIEEGDGDVSEVSELMFPDGMCPISEWWKRGREFGLGGCVVLSSLKPASKLVLQNSTTHIIFHTNDPESNLEASRTLMLGQGGPMTLNQLETGECLVKQSRGWHHTNRGKIDYVPPCRTRVTEYDSHPYVPSRSLSELPYVQKAIRKFKDELKAGKKQTEDKDTRIAEWSKQALHIWASHPYTPMARIFDKIGPISRKQQLSVRELIEQKHCAEFEESRIGRRNMLLMELTEKSYAALRLPVPQGNKGRGGITHRHFAHWMKDFFEKEGLKASIEWVIPGTNHPVDIVVQSKDNPRVFEICVTSVANVLSHIEACFVSASEAIESLTIVTATKTQLNEVRKTVESNALMLRHTSRIKYEVIENYVPKEVPK